MKPKTPPLITDLLRECERRGWTTTQMLDEIGISRTYFISLLNNHKPLAGLSIEKIRSIAKFLRQSVVEVELIAGIKTPDDFFAEQDLDADMDIAFMQMQIDPFTKNFVSFTLADWKKMPRAAKYMMIHLYQECTGKRLLQEIPPSPKKSANKKH